MVADAVRLFVSTPVTTESMTSKQPTQKGIVFKDTRAMPGSQLFQLLSDGKTKEAEKSYRETNERYDKMMGINKGNKNHA